MTPEELNELKRRLRNAERAIIGIVAMIDDTLPPAYAEPLRDFIEDYFSSLPADVQKYQPFEASHE